MSKSFLDLYSNGVNSSLLNLLYKLSKKVNVSIKTPVGVTEEEEIEEVVLQGETLSGFVCTNSVDKISKECELKPVKYRDMDVPKLGYVDDILDITKCGEDTKHMNEYTTQEVNKRKLQLSWDKCARMHIGKKKKGTAIKCKDIFIDQWKESTTKCDGEIKVEDVYVGKAKIKDVDEYEYLGNVITADGKNDRNIGYCRGGG